MKKLTIEAELVGAQYDFYFDDTTRFLHLSGGYGSGKSTALVHKLLKLSMINAPYDGGLVVPTFADFKNDVLPILEDILDRSGIDFVYHGTNHTFKFPWSKGLLRIFSADKKLRGPNVAYMGINELCLIPIERYLEAIGRVRIKDAPFPQIVSSSTPEGIGSPYYEKFVEKPMKGSKILYMNTMENSHNLDPNYIQSLLDTYPKQLIDAYLHGLWVSLSSNRFYFAYTPENNDTDKEKDDSFIYHIGIDFNVSFLASTIWQDYGDKLVAVDEVVLEGGDGFKTENLINALKIRGYTPRNSICYPDPSSRARSTKGDPDADIIKQHGYEVRIQNVAPRFRERQININNLFDKKGIEINPKKCPKLKKDLISVECDPVTIEKNKRNPLLTHASDSMDYLVSILRPFKPRKESRVERLR
jgi:PBSX family phage terminase large subunit